MLSIFNSENAKRIALIKCEKNSFLNNTVIYTLQKMKSLKPEELKNIYATSYILKADNITEELARKAKNSVQLMDITFQDVLDLEQKYELPLDCTIHLLPYDPKKEDRTTISILGSAGCGKTYWINEYMKMYLKLNKDKPVYYLSIHEPSNDPSISKSVADKIEFVDAKNISSTISKDEIENSLLVCDDVDSEICIPADEEYELLTDKAKLTLMNQQANLAKTISKTIYTSAKNIIHNYRKYKSSLLFIAHHLKDRTNHEITNHCDVLIMFPYANYSQIIPFLETRTSLTKKDIEDILPKKSRVFAFTPFIYHKRHQIAIYDNQIRIL